VPQRVQDARLDSADLRPAEVPGPVVLVEHQLDDLGSAQQPYDHRDDADAFPQFEGTEGVARDPGVGVQADQ
jgi:hypothetical protein